MECCEKGIKCHRKIKGIKKIKLYKILLYNHFKCFKKACYMYNSDVFICELVEEDFDLKCTLRYLVFAFKKFYQKQKFINDVFLYSRFRYIKYILKKHLNESLKKYIVSYLNSDFECDKDDDDVLLNLIYIKMCCYNKNLGFEI
jgi:hypothetical protein